METLKKNVKRMTGEDVEKEIGLAKGTVEISLAMWRVMEPREAVDARVTITRVRGEEGGEGRMSGELIFEGEGDGDGLITS